MNRSLIAVSAAVLAALIGSACSNDDDATNASGGSSGKAGSSGRAGNAGAGARSGSANGGQSGSDSEAGAGGEAGSTAGEGGEAGGGLPGSDGPRDESTETNKFVHPVGTNLNQGRDVFRYETFGNEGFWTNVVQLPQGVIMAKFTPVDALKAGLSVDIDAVVANFDAATVKKISDELKTDLSPANAPTLNDFNTTVALIEANAVIGLSARKNNAQITDLDGTLTIDTTDVYAGESVGVTCALCHSITDASVFAVKKDGVISGGTIGKRVDGPTNHFLNVGAAIALGLGSRAFYPTLALDLAANNHMSVSRMGAGVGLISKSGTEAEVDAYLTNANLYPVGAFDDAIDGDGAPMHITPFFRADLAAPWGSEGSIGMLENFNNLVYTALLDQTDILVGGATGGGAQFLTERGGAAAAAEIATNYAAILADMGIPAGGNNGYPFVGRAGRADVTIGLDAGAKVEASPIGMQVSLSKNRNMDLYLNSLPAPSATNLPYWIADDVDSEAAARGRNVFREQCTTCHNDDQSKFVPQNIVAFKTSVEFASNAPGRAELWPGYAPTQLATRTVGLSPVQDSPGIFDDKLIIVDASNRSQPRGDALPLLLDLARKPVFLHDNSVATLDSLLKPDRGAAAPHPFYIADDADRADVVEFLKSLTDEPLDH